MIVNHLFQSARTALPGAAPPRRLHAMSLVAVLILTAGCSGADKEIALFERVPQAGGLEQYVGMTYGAAWGDYDRDGLPDLYVTNHLNEARLFRNTGGGTFADTSRDVFEPGALGGDKHGIAWADFDNDGRPDLVELTGAEKGLGSERKRLFHNVGSRLVDVAEPMGVLNPYGRTRDPLWVDFDGDGRLDLFHGAEARFDDRTPAFLYVQRDGGFAAADTVTFADRSVPFCLLAELTGDDHADLLCRVVGRNRTAQAFDLTTRPPRALDLLPATAFEDVAVADFDNDGRLDLFLTRKNPPGPVALAQPSANEILADVWIDKALADRPMGFGFRSAGQLSVRVEAANPTAAVTPERIHLGAQGAHPAGIAFDLSAATPGIAGLAPDQPGRETGVYIGLTAPDYWEVRVTAPREALLAGEPKYQQIALKVAATEPITKLGAAGEASKDEAAPARLFMNRDGKLVEESEKRGVNARLVPGMNVVAGDFDNDMDVDLFVLASGEIGKEENLLLLNDGKGHFDVVRVAGGAAGSRIGVGDSVTTVDFDGDGFLDLLTATGASMGRSLGLPSEAGGYQLYRNLGNGNHWIEIDLEGRQSNRDGIGAIVRITAGGINQVRLQDGGVHRRGQNHSRLHFGLGKRSQVDRITVYWPSGLIQELRGVAANQVLRISESGDAAKGGTQGG
jgi:hypothetical protein